MESDTPPSPFLVALDNNSAFVAEVKVEYKKILEVYPFGPVVPRGQQQVSFLPLFDAPSGLTTVRSGGHPRAVQVIRDTDVLARAPALLRGGFLPAALALPYRAQRGPKWSKVQVPVSRVLPDSPVAPE